MIDTPLSLLGALALCAVTSFLVGVLSPSLRRFNPLGACLVVGTLSLWLDRWRTGLAVVALSLASAFFIAKGLGVARRFGGYRAVQVRLGTGRRDYWACWVDSAPDLCRTPCAVLEERLAERVRMGDKEVRALVLREDGEIDALSLQRTAAWVLMQGAARHHEVLLETQGAGASS